MSASNLDLLSLDAVNSASTIEDRMRRGS
jgi:hypothetical protein